MNLLYPLLLTFIKLSYADDKVLTPIEPYPGNYLIVAPKSIRPGLPYAVSVNILRQGYPVSVTLKIVDDKNNSLAQVKQDVSPGAPQAVKFEKVPTWIF